MRILIIEDGKRLSDSIKMGLTEAGYAVDQSFDGEDGLFMASSESYDCIILDIILPKIDGLTICKRLREKQNQIPILILTAKNTTEDIAVGLDNGADDYLAKPFAFIELKSRILALIRRNHHEASPILKKEDLTLDPTKHEVARAGRKIALTPREFSILEYLLRHKGEAVTRTMITEHVWDFNFENMSNVVDVYITSLRKKVNQNTKMKLIQTIYGVGFKI
jgi:DNA-binding response OmpR family regulator